MNDLVFVKLGGSLITDKRAEATPRRDVIARLAREFRAALDARPTLRLLLGHGSGSFGHWEAQKYQTRQGVTSPDQWRGFTQVAAAAARLNRLVTDAFLEAGVPVLSLQPSAAFVAEAGRVARLDTDAIERALAHDLLPLIYGDVAFDRAWGGTILSTETLFSYLVDDLRPRRILLLGNAPGVLDDQHRLIPTITPGNYAQVTRHLRGSASPDVTGGMADKVAQMLDLVRRVPGLRVWILTGTEPGNLHRALLDPDAAPGTCLRGE